MSRPGEKAIKRAFGVSIRRLRERKSVSQEQLAHDSKLDRSYIGGIERGERNPSLIALTKIANGLGIPLADIFAEFGSVVAAKTGRSAKEA